ncbi:unnamed protein product [Microthlaspi erraticum]|uniref:DUF4216 domain-containing protein n=1 Tax=Microthlaspi erraticum TaxID=1685480 RepID=A0A6D2L3A9_9BRAS|nr:unnamed protein product [Microthlaspi erraticum]
MCRSSAKDTAQVIDLVSYYGRVVDIILLDYNVFYFPIFLCHWDVRGNGVKVEYEFTLVNMNQSQASFAKDPFILASHARQIFYSRDNDDSSWYVAMRGPSRRYSDKNAEIVNTEVGPLPSEVDMEAEADGGRQEETQPDDRQLEDTEPCMAEGMIDSQMDVQESVRDGTEEQTRKETSSQDAIRFDLEGEYEKAAVMKQMECLRRASKSRLVKQIRKAQNHAERMKLRPDNVPMAEWRKFVKQKTS